LFDDSSRVHDRDPIGKLRYYGEVVGDVEHRDLLALAHAGKLREDLRLGDYVQSGRGLVEHEHGRLGRERGGDAHALLLAA
jgi:hypothetical protein